MNVVSREAGTAKSVAGSYCVKNGSGIIDVLHLYCEHFHRKAARDFCILIDYSGGASMAVETSSAEDSGAASGTLPGKRQPPGGVSVVGAEPSDGEDGSSMLEEGEVAWAEELAYHCQSCQKWTVASQLKGDPPSHLKGDNFFKFCCVDCSPDGRETFERMKLTWQQVVMLAMYNLSLEGSGRQGFFRWKEDICAIIDKYWTLLLGNRKKTSTWWSTVAGCLSVGSPMHFRSGAQQFGEPGWWKLARTKPPSLRPELESVQAPGGQRGRGASKQSAEPAARVDSLRKRSARNAVESAMELKEKRLRTTEAKDMRRAQREGAVSPTSIPPARATPRSRRAGGSAVSSEGGGGAGGGGGATVGLERGEVLDHSSLLSCDNAGVGGGGSSTTPFGSPAPSPGPELSSSSAPGTPRSHAATPSLFSAADLVPDVMPPQALLHGDDEDMELDAVIDPGVEFVPTVKPVALRLAEEGGAARVERVREPELEPKTEVEAEEEEEEEAVAVGGKPVGDAPAAVAVARAREHAKVEREDEPAPAPRMISLSLYEEKLLLRSLTGFPRALAASSEARRLRRKLLVRQAKRERGLPLFDLDRAVERALALVLTGDGREEAPSCQEVALSAAGLHVYRTTSSDFRVLDRYQTSFPALQVWRQEPTHFLQRLVGSGDAFLNRSIISPYTSRVLKPYIRRDIESKPLKVKLLAEIRAFPHRHDPTWTPEPDVPIDYCYVRPNHIPTINSMCRQFFWPGIDLSECLQYPDFSVVVLYKKVIVGFGFMVPDVKYNEAYVSFLLVHPEWRGAGIGTFMIYHLIQTCMGKDITLHVSASNPAMLLYQRFGFKAEEYILDFYDKYYPLDSKECKHAFLLRLRR
ncbi:cysteine-rich protein 2-binding protein isoform X1 [Petromyzon marinus]|uniref:cysteine-rich protein 2-binding protein isoform X1 n=1 Tax=Petromyzon marinus TaxID=7757 RepID=UPI003F7076B5